MKILCIIALFVTAVSSHAAEKPVLDFNTDTIDTYDTNGAPTDSLPIKSLGNPRYLKLTKILDTGLFVLQNGANTFIVDRGDLKLEPGFTQIEEELRSRPGDCLDTVTSGVNGMGEKCK